MNILNHVELTDFDKYEGWMKSSYYDDMFAEDDVQISLHCRNESWAVTFPIVDCLKGVRSHPMFIPHRMHAVDGTERETNDHESDIVRDILKSLEEMAKVTIH